MRKILSITSTKHFGELFPYETIFEPLIDIELFAENLLQKVHFCVNKIAKQNLTPTMLTQQRQKLGGNSSLAQSYRDQKDTKKKWVKFLATNDKSFSEMIVDTLLDAISADDLHMPKETEKGFKNSDLLSVDKKKVLNKLEKLAKEKTVLDILGDIEI